MNKLLEEFIGEHVNIECGSFKAEGKLIGFQPCRIKHHIPLVLILKHNNNIVIVRQWQTIKKNSKT